MRNNDAFFLVITEDEELTENVLLDTNNNVYQIKNYDLIELKQPYHVARRTPYSDCNGNTIFAGDIIQANLEDDYDTLVILFLTAYSGPQWCASRLNHLMAPVNFYGGLPLHNQDKYSEDYMKLEDYQIIGNIFQDMLNDPHYLPHIRVKEIN